MLVASILLLPLLAKAQGTLGCFTVSDPPPASVSSASMNPSICIHACSSSLYALIAPSPVDDMAYWCICQRATPSTLSPVVCNEPCSSGASICGGIDLNTGRLGWSAFAVAGASAIQIPATSSAIPIPANSASPPVVISDAATSSITALQAAGVEPATTSATPLGVISGTDLSSTVSSSPPTIPVDETISTMTSTGTMSPKKAGTQARAPPAQTETAFQTSTKHIQESPPLPESSNTPSPPTANITFTAIIAGGSIGFLAILAACVACFWRRRSERKRASITDVLSLYTVDMRQSWKASLQQGLSQPNELPSRMSQASERSFATTVVASETQTRQSTFSAFSAPFSLQRKPSNASSVFRFGAAPK
ncbi:hypothetical protein BC830DRAFT_1103978 [Chytriomyces sp. MP71]|nr:hypothetical protein BC830DRAFT_1103978 [Chytriomyces sp. MP71]